VHVQAIYVAGPHRLEKSIIGPASVLTRILGDRVRHVEGRRDQTCTSREGLFLPTAQNLVNELNE
jgi:hypothetical protein